MTAKFSSYINLHEGQKALVCGNGRSIREYPPEWYYEWDGPTYGVNRIRYWFDEPTYYFNIYTLQESMCHNGKRILFDWMKRLNKVDLFKTGKLSLTTIGLTAITAAFQMGCSEIHLIGIDFCPHPSGGIYFYDNGRSTQYFRPDRQKTMLSNINRAIESMKGCGVKFINHSSYSMVEV